MINLPEILQEKDRKLICLNSRFCNTRKKVEQETTLLRKKKITYPKTIKNLKKKWTDLDRNKTEDSNNWPTTQETQSKNWKATSNLEIEFLKPLSCVVVFKQKKKKSCLSTKILLMKLKFLNRWKINSKNWQLNNTNNLNIWTTSSRDTIRFFLIGLPFPVKKTLSTKITKC